MRSALVTAEAEQRRLMVRPHLKHMVEKGSLRQFQGSTYRDRAVTTDAHPQPSAIGFGADCTHHPTLRNPDPSVFSEVYDSWFGAVDCILESAEDGDEDADSMTKHEPV